MRVRAVIAAVLAAAGGMGAVAVASARDHGSAAGASTPRGQRTHPRMRPRVGEDTTVFKVRFRLRQTPGHQGVMETSYRVQVVPHRGDANSCWSDQPPPVSTGRKGDEARVILPPPPGGWCTGAYHVTVFLERGPYCPPPTDGRPQPCPEFATQELDTGETHFTVR